jgi:benzylsuccinate CoA-transferase BbsE subunit
MTPLTPLALDGIRIIDLCDVSSVYASKILSDMGAEVIRVEPPDGDPMRHQAPLDDRTGESLFYAFMNVNKRSVVLDLQQEDGREDFRRLVASADIVIESQPVGSLDALGIGYSSFAAGQPALVWSSITPFGSTGPRAGWVADDLVIQAMGGLMNMNGLPDRAPLRLFGEQSGFIAGLHAAPATLMAYWSAVNTGNGQFVDTSIQECIAHTLENAIQTYALEGTVRARSAGRLDAGAGVFPCSDGEIFLTAGLSMVSSSWHNMVALLRDYGVEGADDLLDAKWSDHSWRRTAEARDTAAEVFSRFTRPRTKNQVYDMTQQRGILSAPMNKVGDVFDNAQLKFLQWFEEHIWDDRSVVWPGPPLRMSETPRRTPLRVEAPGDDNDDLAIKSRAGSTPAGRR